jgi:hypothetical protein
MQLSCPGSDSENEKKRGWVELWSMGCYEVTYYFGQLLWCHTVEVLAHLCVVTVSEDLHQGAHRVTKLLEAGSMGEMVDLCRGSTFTRSFGGAPVRGARSSFLLHFDETQLRLHCAH